MFGKSPFARRGLGATTLFFVSMVPFGIAAHLVSELAGLGWHDDADVIFSARHAYLAIVAAMVVACCIFAFRSVSAAQRPARIAALIDELPWNGRGVRFTALSFAAQFAFFAATQLGEGCPLCAGDVVVGVFAAAIAAAIGAIVISLGQRRLVALVCALVAVYRAHRTVTTVDVHAARRRRPFALSATFAAFSFRYRPPPQVA